MSRAEKFWDRQSSSFDKGDKDNQQSYIKTVDRFRKYLNLNDKVLELGCGTGLLSAEVATQVKEVHAVDISSKMVEIARRNAVERQIENIHIAQGTILDERFANGSFDMILAFNILHLVDTPLVISRINNLLKPGGIFISDNPCVGEKRSLSSMLISLIGKLGIVPNVRNLKMSEFKDEIKNNNFQIVETEQTNDMFPQLFVVAQKEIN